MVRDIQRIVDDLAVRLGRPASLDDPNFRLQIYSPQVGPLDDVRVRSILFRDSPEGAKRWVRSHGIAEVDGAARLPRADGLGLLPRVCVPIRHDRTLLGYLWIIDADGSTTDDDLALCTRTAADLAPLLYRRRTIETLDRETERQALADLLADDPRPRASAADRLQRSGILSSDLRPVALVAMLSKDRGPVELTDADAVAFEVGIERTRGLVSEPHIAHLRMGAVAVILLGANDREVARQGVSSIAARVQRLLTGSLQGSRLVVGVGLEQATLADAAASYAQARDAAQVLARVPSLGDIATIDRLSMYRTLLYVPTEVLRAAIPTPLRELLDAPEGSELGVTLETFLDHAGDAASTAAALRLHRATIYKRMARAAERFGLDLGSGPVRRDLHYAFAAARFLGHWPVERGRAGRSEPAGRHLSPRAWASATAVIPSNGRAGAWSHATIE